MRNLAIIPARSGSVGLKDKNIKLLNGKPLLVYSVDAAKQSEQFDMIVVSTDSELYAQIARKNGAEVPFLRSKELSSNTASSWDVVKDLILYYEKKNIIFDTVTLLQPTSPLRKAEHICQGFALLEEKSANAIVSVCEMDHSPLWSNTLPEDGNMKQFLREEIVSSPRQSLPEYYRINGALYIVRVDYLLSKENIYEEKCFAHVMPRCSSIDIDDDIDFKLAGLLLETNK